MVKRKSLGDVLNSEEAAFLETGRAGASGDSQQPPSIDPPATQTAARPAQGILPQSPVLPHESFKTLTVRLETNLLDALLRASMERKLQRQTPISQREIVSEAVRAYLKKHGYLG